jgi:hypothetical protein
VQYPNSNYKEEDVVNDAASEDVLKLRTERLDVESLTGGHKGRDLAATSVAERE